MMKKLLFVLIALVLAGCAAVVKVEGDQVVKDRLSLKVPAAWNRMAMIQEPYELWTQDGSSIDQLRIYAGIKDGEPVHQPDTSGKRKNFSFRSSMQPEDIVAMFEGMMTRDGSVFTLNKLEPMTFGGQKGFRFEFALIRKVDSVQLSGVGFGTVAKGELYALLYAAPQLGFFARHQRSAEQMARSAWLKM